MNKSFGWRIDADGHNPTRLPIPATDSVEDWSPDGQWFVTCSDRHPPHGSGYQLYLMKTDGTQQRRLTRGGLNVYARFSPDGRGGEQHLGGGRGRQECQGNQQGSGSRLSERRLLVAGRQTTGRDPV